MKPADQHPTCIDFTKLEEHTEDYRRQFQDAKPFRYLVIDGLCHEERVQELARAFPKPDHTWIDASGIHTRRKVTSPVPADSPASAFFKEAQSPRFLSWLETVTGIKGLLSDEEYFGAGFHQTNDGGYLNVHIDFNKLPNGLDRRLNLLLYMNEIWEDDWGGEIELWDMEAKACFFSSKPILNRALIFETNEVSYHGQPNPVSTGGKTSRKSFSLYYYSQGRPEEEQAAPHSTIYVNVEGGKGVLKNTINTLRQIATGAPLKRRLRKL